MQSPKGFVKRLVFIPRVFIRCCVYLIETAVKKYTKLIAIVDNVNILKIDKYNKGTITNRECGISYIVSLIKKTKNKTNYNIKLYFYKYVCVSVYVNMCMFCKGVCLCVHVSLYVTAFICLYCVCICIFLYVYVSA